MPGLADEWAKDWPDIYKGVAPVLRRIGFRTGMRHDPDQLLLEFVADTARAGGWKVSVNSPPAPDLMLAHPERGRLFAVCRPMGDAGLMTNRQKEWLDILHRSGEMCIIVTRSDSEALGRWLEDGDGSAAELGAAWRAAVASLSLLGSWAELAGAWVPA